MDQYHFDIEAVVFQSHLNPAPRRDPLEAAEILADMMAKPGFDRDRFCKKCDAWDKGMRAKSSERPPGAISRDSCDGCVLSHLDRAETLFDIRERLFNEWVGERARLDQINEQAKYAQLPAEKKQVQKLRRAAVKAVAAAKDACLMAGFDPAKRRRRRVAMSGEAPTAGLDRPVVTRDFRPLRVLR